MTDNRILDLSEEPVRLKVRYDQLVIERDEQEPVTMPLCEIAAVVASHPQISYSHAVLAGLAKNNAPLIVCDEKRLPCAMMLPLYGNFVQAERFEAQAQAPLPLKKQLWKQIVSQKIAAQGRLLKEIRENDQGLLELSKRVKSGDTGNLEAQASRRYWQALFGAEFKRDREKDDQNKNLNYGYAVLRAIVSRGITAAGLHPSLGLHHHNRYDAFCLADDLMEPFRPAVDRAVVSWFVGKEFKAPLDKEAKLHLLTAICGRFKVGEEERTLFDLAARAASSLVNVFQGNAKKLNLPEV